MRYEFKVAHEVAWAAAVGAGVAAAEIAIRFNPEAIADWRVWAVASAGALVRAAGAASLPVLVKHVKRVAKSRSEA